MPGNLFVRTSGHEDGPNRGVGVIRLTSPGLSYSCATFEMIDGRVNVAHQEDVIALGLLVAAESRTVESPSKRMRIDDLPSCIDNNVIVLTAFPKVIWQAAFFGNHRSLFVPS